MNPLNYIYLFAEQPAIVVIALIDESDCVVPSGISRGRSSDLPRASPKARMNPTVRIYPVGWFWHMKIGLHPI